MSIEQVSDIVKMIGLVVAGLWAAWTFHKLQRVRSAELDNNRKTLDIQRARIEQDEVRTRLLRQQPQLSVKLGIVETTVSTEPYRTLLSITVTLGNEGDQNLKVIFQPPTLTISRAVLDQKSQAEIRRYAPSIFRAEADEPQLFADRILRVGQTRQMALAVVPITEPGPYIIQFDALYCREPFDGEKPLRKEPILVAAVEQAFHISQAASVEPPIAAAPRAPAQTLATASD